MSNKESKKSIDQRRKLLLGVGVGSALSVWKKPIVDQIITPAHAQTSPVAPLPPQDLCPMIVISNIIPDRVSGPAPTSTCSLSFDVLSSVAGTSLSIVSITNTALSSDATITYDTFGEASSTFGPRVIWQGPATNAPICVPLVPIDEVTFTITATCAAADNRAFSQDVTLTQILAQI